MIVQSLLLLRSELWHFSTRHHQEVLLHGSNTGLSARWLLNLLALSFSESIDCSNRRQET